LVGNCKRLIAIEIDRDLVRHLRERYADRPDVEIVEGDALETDWAALAGSSYLLAGNLPYYITTPLLFRILASPRPKRAALLVQREVAARLASAPDTDDYGALTVNVQVSASVRTVARVPAGSFHPKPKVDSAIVLLEPLAEPLVTASEEEPFRKFVQAVFGMRRKQMVRIVRSLRVPEADRAAALLAEADIAPAARPETLTPSHFVNLYRTLR
jgi:16S rRNA (adenine1518-N6/adenine1519-N6)-dimethyltransferase